jgi:hypothetical protein
MTRPSKKPLSGDDKVGYGRPPLNTRFRKGVSGNPRGRPRGVAAARLNGLILQEGYRKIRVQEGDAVFVLPAIQAVIRQQVRLAFKGNGPAQRAVIGMVHAFEREALQAATTANDGTQFSDITDEDRLRAVSAFLTEMGYKLVPIAQDRDGELGSG